MKPGKKYGTSHMGMGIPDATGPAMKGNVPRSSYGAAGGKKASAHNRNTYAGRGISKGRVAQGGEQGDGMAAGRSRTGKGKNSLGSPANRL